MTVRQHPSRRPSGFPVHRIAAGVISLALAAGVWALSAAQQAPPLPAVEASSYASQLPLDRGAAGLWQMLKRLHTRASLLMITVHPDDEDGGTLTYESRGRGTRAMLLCLNRGEGGANVMSDDYFDALGLVRTEELLAADRYYGIKEYWGHVIDYGFSKAKEEAFHKWGDDRALGDAVRVVRMTRPLVITSVFIGGPTDGHGNHQATGQIMQEVFVAAADPNAFPEHIREGLRPWAPLKTYGRVPAALQEGSLSPQGLLNRQTQKWEPAGAYNYINKRFMPGALSKTVEVPTGTYDPVLGVNYLQIAREGLGLQKCQNGGGSIPPAGEAASAYHRFGSRVTSGDRETSFFDGIDISLAGIASLAGNQEAGFLKQGLDAINSSVERALGDFSAAQPEKAGPALAAGLKATNALIQQLEASSLSADAKLDIRHELEVKRVQFNDALVQALGLSMLATVTPEAPAAGRGGFGGIPETFQTAIPGQKFWVNVQLTNQTNSPLQVEKVYLAAAEGEAWTFSSDGPASRALAYNKPLGVRFAVQAPDNAGFTRPYFARPDLEQAYYDILDKRYLNLTHMPYPLSAWADLAYEGVSVRTGQVVQAVQRVTGPGTVLEPLVVAPAISVSIAPRAGIVPLEAKSFAVTTTLQSNVKGPARGTVRLDLPEGWTSTPPAAEFSTVRDGEVQTVIFQVQPKGLQQRSYQVTAVAEYNGRSYREGYRTAGYAGLRPYNLYRASSYSTSGVDVKVAPGLTVGYVTGSGDEVPQSLENLGVKVRFLTAQDLATGDLSRYNAILLGVRTYAVREDLRTYNARLLEYVNNGGVVIVQYNTPEYDQNYGPYPYVMGRSPEEVTNEFSAVQILDPAHPVFSWPNKITTKDFEGWVEERGSKFLQSWDPRYTALLETHDSNQEPQKGGLVYARYGKGAYVYCAYAFYRQLPEGVAGAYRLIANLISLPANPGLRAAAHP